MALIFFILVITIFVISEDIASTRITKQLHWEDKNGCFSCAFLPHCPWTHINSWALTEAVFFHVVWKPVPTRFGPASSLVPCALAVPPRVVWSLRSFICLHGCGVWYGTLPQVRCDFLWLFFWQKRGLIAPSNNLMVFSTLLGFRLFFNYPQIKILTNDSC